MFTTIALVVCLTGLYLIHKSNQEERRQEVIERMDRRMAKVRK